MSGLFQGIFMIKQEETISSDESFGNAVYAVLQDKGIDNFYLTNAVPQMKEVRGKLVIIRRFHKETSYNDFGMYFYWDENTKGGDFSGSGGNIYVEDHYSLSTVAYSTKIQEIEDTISKSRREGDRKKFYLAFCSGEENGFDSLWNISHSIQPEIRDWLRAHYQKRSGGVLVNFAGGADTDKDHSDRTCGLEIVKYLFLMNIGQLIWDSGTDNHPGAYYVMQADGNFVIYRGNSINIYSY
jgi:hypothetical protein